MTLELFCVWESKTNFFTQKKKVQIDQVGRQVSTSHKVGGVDGIYLLGKK